MESLQSKYMQMALKQAILAKNKGEVPVGAVIVDSNYKKIISAAHNLCETNKDPLAHAEILAIKNALINLNQQYLNDCDIYVTLEPCPMCAGAISLSHIRRVYFGAYDVKMGGVEHNSRVFSHQDGLHKPESYGGIMEKKCSELLSEFFLSIRK